MQKVAESAEKLAWEMGGWKSIEVRSHEDFVNHSPGEDPNAFTSAKFYHHYIETSEGRRFLEIDIAPATGARLLSRYYCDGVRSADWHPAVPVKNTPESVRISKEFYIENMIPIRSCPEPLVNYYCGRRPLHELLTGAKLLGVDRLLDRDCDVFEVAEPAAAAAGRIHIFSLDKETATPLRHKIYDSVSSYQIDSPFLIWTAMSVGRVQGHLFPMRSRQETLAGAGTPQILYSYDVTVDEVHFGKDFPKSTFWPAVGPETLILDAIKGTITQPKSAAKAVSKTTQPSNPVRVGAADGSSVVPAASLGIGLALMLAGLILWWRRR